MQISSFPDSQRGMSVLVWRLSFSAVLDYSGVVGVLDAWHASHTLHIPTVLSLSLSLSSPLSWLASCWLSAGQSPGLESAVSPLSLSHQPDTLNCHNLCPLIICQILLKFFILSPAFQITFYSWELFYLDDLIWSFSPLGSRVLFINLF